VYRSYTVRSLNKFTEKPFIGKRAHEQQLEKWRALAVSTKEKYTQVTDEITALQNEATLISRLGLPTLIDQAGSGIVLESLDKQQKALTEKKRNLPTATVNELRVEYEKMKDDLRALNNAKRRLYEDTGKLRSDQLKLNEDLVAFEAKQDTLRNEMTFMAGDNLALEEDAYVLFHQEIGAAKDPLKVELEYRKRIETELGNLKNLEDSLRQKQFKYTNTFNLGYPYGLEHMGYYLEELNKLVKSELVKYESKVREAREAAEKLFKEDFIAKLRNYIVSAQDEIGKINATLKQIHFGDDTYEFIFPKSKEYAEYYDMVLADESLKAGTEIFNYDFEMKYQRQLEELFINLAQDDLNSNGAINKFTDYRTYMDYDIKIINVQGDVIMYSKVFKEKSGGETQVPFYVATIASFVRVFQQATRGNVSDSIGLILFDEVFDKMDTTRIKAMMEFILQLPVQIILATPPQKMEVLSKYTDTTIVTMRDGKAARAYEVVQKY
ncbi:MAG: SbcC/MukB-like Walker B domain-containing protein, partial [bacterium]